MKKLFTLMLTAIFAFTLTSASIAEESITALEAFKLLTGQSVTAPELDFVWERSPAEYLEDIMNGKYDVEPLDDAAAKTLAADLEPISAITSTDISEFAVAKVMPEEQVRNSYFKALATVLRAEIIVEPASEARYRNIQLILSLFLDGDDNELAANSREAIRSSMSREYAEVIATNYSLPTSFVEFVIMDDDWDDDEWDNDDDWTMDAGYDWSYGDTPDYDTPDNVATPDNNTPDYNTPDNVATPDKNTPDKNSPDTPVVTAAPVSYDNTPDKVDTPDKNTPDKVDTPDKNTPDKVNTPDKNTPDTPEATAAPVSYDNTPDKVDTPDNNTPDKNTPDKNTPDNNTPDKNTPDKNTPDD